MDEAPKVDKLALVSKVYKQTKNWNILSLNLFFFTIICVKKWSQYICSPIYIASIIINPKIILENLFGPTNLFKAQIFCIHKITKVFMIGEYKNFMFAIF